jgi:hypothetical protein
MSRQHTPGPWAAECWSCHAPTTVLAQPRGQTRVIAECAGPDSLDEDTANARLIAAAPELLEALRAFRNAAVSWHNFHHGSSTVQCDALCEAIPAAEAAIDKAVGRSDEPREPDGEAFRGREAAGYFAEQQAEARRLK